jgi:putative tricarboxylic transport membrane protein
MNKPDATVALLFLALGLSLIVSAYQLPSGMGRLPGPGFFPALTGLLIVILAAFLLGVSLRRQAPRFEVHNKTALAVTIGLLAAYLLLWGKLPFAIRTVVLLVVFLRFLGERWRTSVTVAIVLSVAVLLAFQYGLRVDLQ